MSKSTPILSVIMPVYNSDKYLAESIESILNQTLKDFEFILICDEPSGKTREIINNYQKNDNRIIVFYQKRKGLVAALNKGCAIAKGKYIARMDADDISHPERLEKQVTYMEIHPECAVVATYIEWIDESGNFLGYWSTDMKTKTSTEIRKILPRENCIAHPSIVVRQAVISKYQYDSRQKNAEDYDLWLRMTANGLFLCKLPEILLKLRIHKASIMSRSKKNTPGFEKIQCKIRFLFKQAILGKISIFHLSVFFYLQVHLFIWPIRFIQFKLTPKKN